MTEPHADRVRAESFGSVAERYDRFRPGYADALLDDLAALRPGRVLDVGCGTGRVAAALASRGLDVLGLEPDERMAAVARGHGLAVEVAPFETWADGGRRFDLVTCGQAWHWVDPRRGPAKAAEVLRPGGTLALLWNTFEVDEPVAAALDGVYARLAPDVECTWRPQRDEPLSDPVHGSAAFTPFAQRSYRWERSLTPDGWVGLAGTFSDHLRIGPQRLATLLASVRDTVDGFGPAIRVRFETLVLTMTRTDGPAAAGPPR